MDWQHMMWHDYLSLVIGIAGVIVIVTGVIIGFWEFVRCLYRSWCGKNAGSLDDIRYELGRYLLLGLEFLIAADIVHTIIQPTLEQVALLAGIVVIRTIISYFLNREMVHAGSNK